MVTENRNRYPSLDRSKFWDMGVTSYLKVSQRATPVYPILISAMELGRAFFIQSIRHGSRVTARESGLNDVMPAHQRVWVRILLVEPTTLFSSLLCCSMGLRMLRRNVVEESVRVRHRAPTKE